MKCPLCNEPVGDDDSQCPHCGAGLDGLTEEQVATLQARVHDNYLNTLIIAVFIGGMSLALGCVGIYIGMIGPIVVGFVLLAISLAIAYTFLGKARDSDRALARWDKKGVVEKRVEEKVEVETKVEEDMPAADLHVRRVRKLKRKPGEGPSEAPDEDLR